jgi:hypothetical protein
MVLYHRTGLENAQAIFKEGFRDRTGNYRTESLHTGVWLSNVPLDVNEGAVGDVLLEVTFNCPDAEIDFFEWIEDGKPYREWLMPAAFVNLHATVRIIKRYAGSAGNL